MPSALEAAELLTVLQDAARDARAVAAVCQRGSLAEQAAKRRATAAERSARLLQGEAPTQESRKERQRRLWYSSAGTEGRQRSGDEWQLVNTLRELSGQGLASATAERLIGYVERLANNQWRDEGDALRAGSERAAALADALAICQRHGAGAHFAAQDIRALAAAAAPPGSPAEGLVTLARWLDAHGGATFTLWGDETLELQELVNEDNTFARFESLAELLDAAKRQLDLAVPTQRLPLQRCSDCGHQPHAAGRCLNMASDNDCSCGKQTPTRPTV